MCTALPHVTEQVQWQNDLVFKVGGKMFAIAVLEPSRYWVSFKCSPERYSELLEHEGVAPAPYLARAYWVALETPEALHPRELEVFIQEAHRVVLESLPKKLRDALEGTYAVPPRAKLRTANQPRSREKRPETPPKPAARATSVSARKSTPRKRKS